MVPRSEVVLLADRVLAFALLGADWVLWLLVGLSFLCIAVAGGRVLRAFGDRDDGAVDSLLTRFSRDGDAKTFGDALRGAKGPAARVLASGLEAAEERGPEAAEEMIAAALGAERSALESGLAVLATTGSNAPFIGLFGTVLGIIRAFHGLSLQDASAAAGMMAGISEALVSTAVGLLVAIPAVVMYNVFARQNKSILARAENRGRILLSRYKGAPRQGA